MLISAGLGLGELVQRTHLLLFEEFRALGEFAELWGNDHKVVVQLLMGHLIVVFVRADVMRRRKLAVDAELKNALAYPSNVEEGLVRRAHDV